MGNATSSALRVDESAYGSLEGMGTGFSGVERRFKKKPVLVLDAEELAAAHAAFHEASAEQLGQTVERAERPAMILGLAPMEHDDIDEMGQSDEIGEDADADLPSPEEVLALTRRKSTALDDDYDTGTIGNYDDMAGMPDMRDQAAHAPAPAPSSYPPAGLPSDAVEDGLDLSKRIFPSLPLVALDDDDGENDFAPVRFPGAVRPEPAPMARIVPLAPVTPPAEPQPPAPAASGGEPHNAPSREPDHEQRDVPDTAGQPADAASASASASASAPKPVRFDELNPAKDYNTPEEVYDLDRWLVEDNPAADAPVTETPADAPQATPADTGPATQAHEAAAANTGESDTPSASAAQADYEPDARKRWSAVFASREATVVIPDDLAEDFAPEVEADPEAGTAPAPVSAVVPEPAEPATPATNEAGHVGDASAPASVHEDMRAETPLDAENDIPAPPPAAQIQDAPDAGARISYTDDDTVDGYAFMYEQRSRRAAVTATPRGQQSALRAKLIGETPVEALEQAEAQAPRSLFARLWHALRGGARR